jgi:hypothetical protein
MTETTQPAIKLFNMSFTQEELNTIINALSELPFKHAQPLISKLVKDFNSQSEVE